MTLPYPRIPPEIFRVGPLALRWYGVMYLVGYIVGFRIIARRIALGTSPLDRRKLDTLIGYLAAGMLVGARLAYALVYEPGHYLGHPWSFFAIWQGGLSFHGAIVGMATACLVFARRERVPFWSVADTVALAGTPGLFFGRIGNFINGELYGRPSTVPWAMVFPTDALGLPRHPSQLYEAVGEGLVLFLALSLLDRRLRTRADHRSGLLTAGFLVGYGVLRFALEFTRQPDAQLGFVLGPFSAGQCLSTAMVVTGLVLAFLRRARRAASAPLDG